MCWQAKYTVKQLKGVFPADVRRYRGKVAKYTLSLSACVSVWVPTWSHLSDKYKNCITTHTAGVSLFWTYRYFKRGFYISPSLSRLDTRQPVYVVNIVEHAIEGAGVVCTSGQWNANKSFINKRCHGVSRKLNYLSGRVSWKWGWRGSGLILAHYNLQCEWEVSDGQTSLGNTIMTHGGKREPQRRSEEYQVLLSYNFTGVPAAAWKRSVAPSESRFKFFPLQCAPERGAVTLWPSSRSNYGKWRVVNCSTEARRHF